MAGMSRLRSTTSKRAMRFVRISKRSRPSTKKKKQSGRVFGMSSQFAGVGIGVRGDPRR